MKQIIFALALAVGAPIPATFAQQSSKPAQRGHINPSFEQPAIEKEIDFVEDIEGWTTTDNRFEIWRGYNSVKAYDGEQCVELNADKDGTLFQDSDGIKAGEILEFTFAHRGRNGNDTMKLTITDLGPDGKANTPDDEPLFSKQYTTGNDKWMKYTHEGEKQIVAKGNTIRFAYTAIFGTAPTGNDKSQGNLLDAADFGVGVVTTPQFTFVNKKGDGTAELHLTLHDTGERVKGPQGQDNHVYEIETADGWLHSEGSGDGAAVKMNGTEKTKWVLHQHSKGYQLVCLDDQANVLSVDGVNPKGGGKPTGNFKLRRANAGGAGMEDQVFEMFRGGLADSVPKDAAKLDIKGGPFQFGYLSIASDVGSFKEFELTDQPFAKDKITSIERRNKTAEGYGAWWSVCQNTSDSPINHKTDGFMIHYPAKSEGSVILHPGPNKGESVVAQYTAQEDGHHVFNYNMSLIMESPTGVGVSIYGPKAKGSAPLWTKALDKNTIKATHELQIDLKKGETVTLVVDNGPDGIYYRDHLAVTAAAWIRK
ncbi:MAG: hypothetical protein R3C01_10880 [Planctomycetaceae bacterium]